MIHAILINQIPLSLTPMNAIVSTLPQQFVSTHSYTLVVKRRIVKVLCTQYLTKKHD